MPGNDRLNYGRLMQKALRGLMSEVLGQVAEDGLPGEHHFYIGFDTTHPGVDMADWLHERYPEEMTIVLQDWFDDLAVMGDRFRVTLNFSDSLQTLVVPFDAVKTFVDPSAEFGLKFDAHESSDEDDEDEDDAEDITPDDDPDPDDDGPQGGEKPAREAEVVSLDKFRRT